MNILMKQDDRILMRILLTFSLLIFGLMGVTGHAHAAKAEHIAATVDAEAISTSELQDRLRMIILSTGQKPSREVIEQFTPQVLGSLIEEQVQLQEAERLGLEVSPQEIRTQFEQIAARNKADPDKFEKMIVASGINIKTMRDQIRAQIAWSKVVQSTLRSKVNVTDNDVQNHIDRFQRSIGKEEYWVAKILLPVEDEKKDAEMQKLAKKLVSQIKSGKADFGRVAQQFSKAPGAMQGGAMGWVQVGQLSPELNAVLDSSTAGEISAPVRLSDGYHILFVQKKRLVEEANTPTKEQIINALGMARLDRLQRRYLLDLKAAAFIDVRV